MENYSKRTQTINQSFRLTTHRLSDSSNASITSSILSMCPLDVQSTNFSLSEQDDQASTSSSIKYLPKTSNRRQSKRIFQRGLLRSIKSSRDDSDLISISSCLSNLIIHPIIDEDPTVIRQSSVTLPTRPIGIKLTSERINQLEQREDGLNRAVKELLEAFKSRTNERIKEINKYWSYIQSNLLDKYQSKINPYQLFESFRNSSLFNNQYQTFLTLNPDINAMLLVLTTILSMIHQETTISSIIKIFSRQEKLFFDNLREQLEFVLSSYTDELSFIRERCNFYRSNSTEENNYHWMQVIQTDYPDLIEKISNDYITKIPQIHTNLFQLLTDIKINLLKFHFL